MKELKIMHFEDGMTIKELKDLIKDWPEKNFNGADNEVWLRNYDDTSSPCRAISPLNLRTEFNHSRGFDEETSDILFE